MVLAWQKAISHGYRRIGVILLDHHVQIADDILRISAVNACQGELFPRLPIIPPLRFSDGDPAPAGEFVKWIRTHRPDVLIGFSAHYFQLYHSEFGRKIPYISLHANPSMAITGIPDDTIPCIEESVNLLHFCRRTYQWGIPARRIHQLLEPTWSEGTTLPAIGEAVDLAAKQVANP